MKRFKKILLLAFAVILSISTISSTFAVAEIDENLYVSSIERKIAPTVVDDIEIQIENDNGEIETKYLDAEKDVYVIKKDDEITNPDEIKTAKPNGALIITELEKAIDNIGKRDSVDQTAWNELGQIMQTITNNMDDAWTEVKEADHSLGELNAEETGSYVIKEILDRKVQSIEPYKDLDASILVATDLFDVTTVNLPKMKNVRIVFEVNIPEDEFIAVIHRPEGSDYWVVVDDDKVEIEPDGVKNTVAITFDSLCPVAFLMTSQEKIEKYDKPESYHCKCPLWCPWCGETTLPNGYCICWVVWVFVAFVGVLFVGGLIYNGVNKNKNKFKE